MSRLGRFLHLERSRADRPEAGADRGANAGRFGTVEPPSGTPAAPAGSGAALERFGAEPPPPLELARAAAGERPFTRCMRCGMDHHLFATECTGCGERLDTGPQREFNDRLWAARQEEAAREARAEEERRALAAREAAGAGADLRSFGEQLAREVGRRERLRLDAELGGGGWDEARRLLRRLFGRRGGTP